MLDFRIFFKLRDSYTFSTRFWKKIKTQESCLYNSCIKNKEHINRKFQMYKIGEI